VAADFNILLRAKDQASAAVKKVKGEFVDLNGVIDKHEKALKRAGIAGAVVVAGLAAMTKGAATQRATQRQLAAALDSIGVSYDKVGASIEATLTKQQSLTNFSDEDQRESLRILVGTLGNYEQAMQALPAVLDAAAFSGTGLRETSKTLSRALAGNVDTAESVGLTFAKTADFGERLSQVFGVAGGSAEAARDPFTAIGNSLLDIGDSLGESFLPLVEKAAAGVGALAEWVEKLDDDTIKLLGIMAGTGGIVAIMGALVVKVRSVTKALRGMSIASAFASGGVTAIAGAVGAFGLSLAMDAAFDSTEDATESMDKFGKQTKATADSAKSAADGIDAVSEAAAGLEKSAASAAEKILKPLVDSIHSVRVETGKIATDEDVGLMLADAFGLLEEIKIDTSGFQTLGRYENAMESFADVLTQLRPDIREGFNKTLGGLVDTLGLTAESIEAKGGSIDEAMADIFRDLPEETEAVFDKTVQDMREALNNLDPSDAFMTAKEKSVAGAEALAEETLPVVTTFVDAAVAKAAELVPAFEEIGEGLPFALAAGINSMAGVLEQGFNLVVLGWLEQAIDQLNQAAAALGAPSPFNNVSLPGGLKLPRVEVPAFARGVRNFSGGSAFVGEEGTELVNLPRGASVTPADQLMRVVDSIDRMFSSGALAGGSDLARLARGGGFGGAGVAALNRPPELDAFGRASGASGAGSARGGGAGGSSFTNYGTFQLMASSDAQSREILDALVTP